MADFDIAKRLHTHTADDISDATVTGKALMRSIDGTAVKSAAGLNQVDNTADLDKPISNATQAALNLKANSASLTKAGVGLDQVDNTSDVNKPISNATQSALNLKPDTASLTKAMVGLGNVDNTSDLSKPVSTATQSAINAITPDNGGKAVGKGEILFRVADYGADVAGLADATTAINSCITAANAAGGGTVLFTAGKTYSLASNLLIKSNVTLAGKATLQATVANTKYMILVQNVSNIVISDITIDLNKAVTVNQNSTSNQQGIYLSSTTVDMSNIVISGVTIKNGWQRGIASVPSTGRAISDVIIERCNVSSVGDVGVFISGIGNVDRTTPSPSQRVTIRNNIVADGGKGGIQVNGYSYVKVADNYLDGTASTGHGICFGTSGTTGHVTDFNCYGNVVKNYTAAGKWGILASNNAKRFSISDNPVVFGNTGGISIDVEDSANLNVLVDVSGTVSGNSVKGSVGGNGSHGINARICSNLTIIGNTCTNNAGSGVAISNAYACTITGNTLNTNTVNGVSIFGTNAGTGGHRISGNTTLGNIAGSISNSFPPIAVVTDSDTSTGPIVVIWSGSSWGTYNTDATRVRFFMSQNDVNATAPTSYNSNDIWFGVSA